MSRIKIINKQEFLQSRHREIFSIYPLMSCWYNKQRLHKDHIFIRVYLHDNFETSYAIRSTQIERAANYYVDIGYIKTGFGDFLKKLNKIIKIRKITKHEIKNIRKKLKL